MLLPDVEPIEDFPVVQVSRPRPGYDHDWATLKQLYIEGPDGFTLPILARQENVPFIDVERRSRKEGWARLRAEFRQDVADRIRREAIKRHVDMRIELLDEQRKLIKAALAQLYDETSGALKTMASLQDLDRLLNTYDRILARETGEDAPQVGTRINIMVAQGLGQDPDANGNGGGLLAIASRGKDMPL